MTVLTEQEKRNEQLLQQLRDDVAAVTPDPWDKILARVQAAEQPEPETVVPLPQRSRRGGAWRRWVAAAVFLLAVLGGGFYAVQTPDGVATLDANPSIELTVNKLGRVLSVRACNADAQIVLDELEQHALKLLHAKTGAALARDVYGADDEIYNAILWHTTGKANMTLLEKVIYLADYIEPNRDFDGVEDLRKVVWEDLDKGLEMGLAMTVEEMEQMGNPVHHNTLQALEYLRGHTHE